MTPPPAKSGPAKASASPAVGAATLHDVPGAQRELVGRIAGLLAAGGQVRLFETHISWVLVAGAHAWKIKKALRLPYLDFSTLAARRFYCMEELRLNRRLAPDLYVAVVSVTGTSAHPALGGEGAAQEYAVLMRAFGQQAVWDFRLVHGLLGDREVDMLAPWLARFHLEAPRAPPAAAWGAPGAVAAAFGATLDELAQGAGGPDANEDLAALRRWEAGQHAVLASRFARRKTGGMIRECHGDLHCGNILTLDGQVQVFDCIEFSEALRWIDVMDDLAFLHMDLALHGRPELAASLLSGYLETSGDYAGLAVLPYYRVHRALVRAKVMLLRARQSDDPDTAAAAGRDGVRYLAFARACARRGPLAILITHGCSGSGKTHFSRLLVKELGAVQLRSDVERKRLAGAGAAGAAGLSAGEAPYGAAATQRTYARLLSLAREIVGAGWPVVVDATFLAAAERARFRALAAELDVPFFIVDLRARRSTMLERLHSRKQDGSDASDADAAVLGQQLRAAEALAQDELARAIVVDTEAGTDAERVRSACAPVLAAMAASMPPVQGQAARFDPAHTHTHDRS
jgi:aminoglycoside phosphotransferase family enzyme/predicted kinase